ncbi:hypothetical protein F2Q70_00002961 [Brassica cretica]|uniref:Uncharacterized protein n=1 Tax=Brassica cretica TaxID=69181 RepID=A0A8S9ITA4_BRACR|nr:hypothetical protein F2Q70_00002961 [Brassica cretica]
MSKRFASSIPAAADRARLKRRMDSLVSHSDGSSEPCEGSGCDLMAPVPLSCVYAAPPLVGHASSVGEDELAEWRNWGAIHALVVGLCSLFEISPSQLNPPAWRILIAIQNLGDLEYMSFGINEVLFAYHLALLNGGEGRFHLRPRSGLPIVEQITKILNLTFFAGGTHPAPLEGESTVLRARQLPIDHHQASGDYFYAGNMSGNVADDLFTAYQEAAKVMSAKNGSSSRTVSGDEVKITGSGGVTTRSVQQSADIARFAGRDPSEVVQVLQGGLLRLYHLGERLSNEGLSVLQEEIEDLKRQVSKEKDQCAARELEIRDLKDKMKDLKKVAEASSADALATSQKNQELEEEINVPKAAAETFKLEMVMAVNGARVVARWELMREWLKKQSDQWELAKALEQYKVVIREEARNKGAPPTFEDEPDIPLVPEMDMDSPGDYVRTRRSLRKPEVAFVTWRSSGNPESPIDNIQSCEDRHQFSSSDRQPTLTYQVRLPSIDVAWLNEGRNPSKLSKKSTNINTQQSEVAAEPMIIVQATEGHTLRRSYPCALCDTGSSVTIMPKAMADPLSLPIEPSKDSFTFVDCSKVNSRGIVRNLQVQIGSVM